MPSARAKKLAQEVYFKWGFSTIQSSNERAEDQRNEAAALIESYRTSECALAVAGAYLAASDVLRQEAREAEKLEHDPQATKLGKTLAKTIKNTDIQNCVAILNRTPADAQAALDAELRKYVSKAIFMCFLSEEHGTKAPTADDVMQSVLEEARRR